MADVVVYRCRRCGDTFAHEQDHRVCPSCGDHQVEVAADPLL